MSAAHAYNTCQSIAMYVLSEVLLFHFMHYVFYLLSFNIDPRNRSKLFIEAAAVQDGGSVSPFIETLMVVRTVTELVEDQEPHEGMEQHSGLRINDRNQAIPLPHFEPDMIIRAVFHQMSVQDHEKKLVRDRVYRIYDPHIMHDFHSRDSSLTLLGDVEVPTVICTQLMEVVKNEPGGM